MGLKKAFELGFRLVLDLKSKKIYKNIFDIDTQ